VRLINSIHLIGGSALQHVCEARNSKKEGGKEERGGRAGITGVGLERGEEKRRRRGGKAGRASVSV